MMETENLIVICQTTLMAVQNGIYALHLLHPGKQSREEWTEAEKLKSSPNEQPICNERVCV